MGSFISGYVARESACDTSLSYVPEGPAEEGDGICFTKRATAIPKRECLRTAKQVQQLFDKGDRAIQQLVISFSPEYLTQMGLVPAAVPILERGDYTGWYDDVRLRYALRSGLATLLERDGYHHGDFIGAIQSDTLHLHAHVVAWEDGVTVGRRKGAEEKGLLKDSSLRRLSAEIHRSLEHSKDLSVIPVPKLLYAQKEVQTDEQVRAEQEMIPMPMTDALEKYLLYLKWMEEQELEEEQSDVVEQTPPDAVSNEAKQNAFGLPMDW